MNYSFKDEIVKKYAVTEGRIYLLKEKYEERLRNLDDAIEKANELGNLSDYDIFTDRKDVYSKVVEDLEELVK